MQNSELFRRGIVLPMDANAEQNLRSNDIGATEVVQHIQIDSDSLFESLWDSGLFQAINQRCGTSIDDYEEEFVEASDVQEITAIVELMQSADDRLPSNLKSFLKDLHALSLKASEVARPILFVL